MIKRLVISGTLFFIFLNFTACVSMLMKVSGLNEKDVKLKRISNGEKEVVFFPMHHIGMSAFYEDVASQVDSLNKLGYITLYETIKTNLTDSLELYQLRLKYRKISGISFPPGESYISFLKKAGADEIINKHGLVDQPSYYALNVDTVTAIRADLPMERLIGHWEEQQGEIVLDECDLESSLDSKYECTTLPKELQKKFYKVIIHDLRNKKIAESIYATDSTKLILIYGSDHFKGLLSELKQRDSGWAEG